MAETQPNRIEPAFFLDQLGMEFVESYQRGANLVYHAGRPAKRYEVIVKIPLSRKNPYDFEQFSKNLEQFESEVYCLEATKDLKGITKTKGVSRVELPQCPEFQDPKTFRGSAPVMIKFYVPGATLADGKRITGKDNQNFIEETLTNLYNRGICLIDNTDSAIVVTPNGRPVVIDAGFVSTGPNQQARKYNFQRSLEIVRKFYAD